jgi:hypothetical protein
MFFAVANWENDFFGYSTGVIRSFVIVQVVAAIVYGSRLASSRVGSGMPVRASVVKNEALPESVRN